jgi:hypothetical protein
MREIITLCEAPVTPVTGSADLQPQVMKIYAALKAEDFEFDARLVTHTVEVVEEKKAEYAKAAERERAYLGDEFNAADWTFDSREHFLEIITPLLKRVSYSYAARSEAKAEAIDYQHALASDLNDPNDYIESSGFLTALEQQMAVGRSIELGRFDPAKIETWAPFLAEIQTVIDTFASFDPNAERVAPRWLPCIHKDLSQVLPVMVFMVRNKIV